MAVEQNIAFYVGEDITLDDTIYEDGAPATISSWQITCIVKNSAGTTVLTYTVGTGILVSTSPIARIIIPRADTKSLTPGQYDYEVCRTDSGENAVLTIGKLTLRARVYPAAA